MSNNSLCGSNIKRLGDLADHDVKEGKSPERWAHNPAARDRWLNGRRVWDQVHSSQENPLRFFASSVRVSGGSVIRMLFGELPFPKECTDGSNHDIFLNCAAPITAQDVKLGLCWG